MTDWKQVKVGDTMFYREPLDYAPKGRTLAATIIKGVVIAKGRTYAYILRENYVKLTDAKQRKLFSQKVVMAPNSRWNRSELELLQFERVERMRHQVRVASSRHYSWISDLDEDEVHLIHELFKKYKLIEDAL